MPSNLLTLPSLRFCHLRQCRPCYPLVTSLAARGGGIGAPCSPHGAAEPHELATPDRWRVFCRPHRCAEVPNETRRGPGGDIPVDASILTGQVLFCHTGLLFLRQMFPHSRLLMKLSAQPTCIPDGFNGKQLRSGANQCSGRHLATHRTMLRCNRTFWDSIPTNPPQTLYF